MSFARAVAEVEALEAVALAPALLARCERAASRGREIRFHTPDFKRYSSAELVPRGGGWPAVSITGGACKLQCDHCRAKILEPMLPATTPEALWRVASETAGAGGGGMLLSGGSNHRDEVEYGPFLPTVARIKRTWPGFRIAMHTALVDRDMARRIEDAGVDAAMLDIIGAQDTVQQVYHLRRPVADFEASLAALCDTSLKVVPHIVIGLHYGRLLGEWVALEMAARHRIAALVLVVAMPWYADPRRPFITPSAVAAGGFFLDARCALPDTPVLLGCARPAGGTRLEIDAWAVLAGLDGIAHPAEGIVELAARLGRPVRVTPACCSIGLGEDVFALEDPRALRLDVEALLARSGPATRPAGRGRVIDIPVVAA